MWQRKWDERRRAFRLVAVAQDVQGEERVRAVVDEREVTFPVLVDRSSLLARSLGFTQEGVLATLSALLAKPAACFARPRASAAWFRVAAAR